MENFRVKIRKLNDLAEIPVYQTPGAACCDLRAAIAEPITLEPGERTLVPTGLAIELESPSAVALIFARSGLASKFGVALSNGVGVIDSDYRGEIKVALVNGGGECFTVNPGDRVAQMGFFPGAQAGFEQADALGETERGAGGFGHTGT